MKVVTCTRWRKPWRVKWSRTRAHYLESPEGRLVAHGFGSLWDALMWASDQ